MDNVYDIKKEKKLDFILPKEYKLERTIVDIQVKKILVVIHLHYFELLNMHLNYIKNIPDNIDIMITTSNVKIKNACLENKMIMQKKCKIIEKKNRGRDISAFLVTCRRDILTYDYVCFLHDKKEKCKEHEEDVKKWVKCLWENTIGSENYIENICMLLDENPQIGLIVPPPLLSDYSGRAYANTWYNNFHTTEKLAKKMGLICDLDENKMPITLGTVFWAKTVALKKLFEIDWKYEDFDDEPLKSDGTISHAIERILAYVAQDANFDAGWVMTDEYAAEQIEYVEELLKKVFDRLDKSLGVYYVSALDKYEEKRTTLLKFFEKNKKVYIYGAGVVGKSCFTMLENLGKKAEAFLVSNVSENLNEVQGLPVYSLSQIEINKDDGIIVAVGKEYQDEILQVLKANLLNYPNIYLYSRI